MLPFGDTIALAGLIIVGLGCAPVFPCLLHETPENFGEENSQAIMGIQMASAYLEQPSWLRFLASWQRILV